MLVKNTSLTRNELEQFYNFTHEHQHAHLIPITSAANAGDQEVANTTNPIISGLVNSNMMLYHPQISAVPLNVETVKQSLCPNTLFGPDAIAEFNKYARQSQKMRARNGVVYRDIVIDADPNDDLDDDDELEDLIEEDDLCIKQNNTKTNRHTLS